MRIGYRNPYLADSESPIAHRRCDQQDCSPLAGPQPQGRRVIGDRERQYAWLGPGHFGSLISGPYPDGRRVIWSNGRQQIAKLDYDTLEVLATLEIGDEATTSVGDMASDVAGLDDLTGDEAISHAAGVAMRYLTGLAGVDALLDDKAAAAKGMGGRERRNVPALLIVVAVSTVGFVALFDLQEDIAEKINLAGKRPELVRRFRKYFDMARK